MITAEIICDSINPVDVRLTTFVCKYPRFIHSEVMTHRALSKNASSSRAIPVEKMIQSVMNNPAMPIHWGRNQKGMQAAEELKDDSLRYCQSVWREARDVMCEAVSEISSKGLHKQVANRLLEPWTHMTTLISATEWANFFSLRVHPDAQPEFQELAYQMLKAYVDHQPDHIQEGQWHAPFNDDYLFSTANKQEDLLKACIGRCARVSYKNQDGNYSLDDDLALYNRIAEHRPLHATPMEHVAQARSDNDFCPNYESELGRDLMSNFRGWTQYRKIMPEENITKMDFKKHLEEYQSITGHSITLGTN